MSVPRQHPRFAHAAALVLRAAALECRGTTTNLSRGGLCADLDVAFLVGTEVEVDIQLELEGQARSESLRMSARVVWCTRIDGTNQVGLSFHRPGVEQIEYLSLFLKYLDQPRERAHVRAATVDERFS